MSSKKEEKAQAAAERIEAVTLTAAKGISRAQAEQAAAAAARNVNAYGQKEEGPSRWQEHEEAKQQMYLMSTEKSVKLGERKDLKSSMSYGAAAAQCQKCFQMGHWTDECTNEGVYISRPSRTQQLKNPKQKMKQPVNPDIPSSSKGKRKHCSDSDSGSGASKESVSSEEEGRPEEEEETTKRRGSVEGMAAHLGVTQKFGHLQIRERRGGGGGRRHNKKRRPHGRCSSSSSDDSMRDCF